MNLRKLLGSSAFKPAVLFLAIVTSPEVFAISEYIETQSLHSLKAIIYGLLGVMTLLFITPVLQFYFASVKTLDQKKAHEQLAHTSAENETLKHQLQTITDKLEQVENVQSTVFETTNLADDIDVAVLEGQCESAQNEISALLSQVDSLKQCICEKDQSIEVLDHQLSMLEAEQENATGFINQITEQLTAQKKAMTLVEQKAHALTTQSDNEAISALQSQLDQLTSESMLKNDTLLKEKAAINDELASTKVALDKAKHQVCELSQTSERLNLENKKQTELIDNLMDQLSVQRKTA